MLKLFIVLLAAFALSEARFARYAVPREELVETRWMDRKISENSRRIHWGEPADIAEFPYMVALIDLALGGFMCGGSIISSHWSLSAAHCTEFNTPYHMLNLRGGSTNRNTGGIIFIVEQYWNHPLHRHPSNIRTFQYDISIIRTQTNSPMEGTHVQPVAIAPVCPSGVCCNICGGTNILVAGWGRIETGERSDTLNQITAPVEDWNECQRIWGRFAESFFCIQVIGGRDVCSGDSGSPLVTGTGASRIQHGIVSFGTATCGDGVPSVHIRIEHPPVRDWINAMSGI